MDTPSRTAAERGRETTMTEAEALAEAERRREVAEGLKDILAVLNSNRPLEVVLGYLVDRAGRLLGTDTVAIFRLDHETGLLSIQAARGLPDEYVSRAVIPVGEGGVGRAVLSREPVHISDTSAGPPIVYSVPDNSTQSYLVEQRKVWRALLAVPLIIKEEVYGGIVLYYRSPRQVSPEEIDLAATFADQVALAIENARLRDQIEQAAVAAERNRLARDLHDAVTQTLFSASLIAEVLPRIWERDPAEGKTRLAELRQLTRGALAEMRTLLLELRPAALVEASLPDLLKHLCEAITGRSRIPVTLRADGARPLPADVQIAYYRIAQEALNNVAKHSAASRAEVELLLGADQVEMRVRDDGKGFELSAVPPDHLGLGIMRERAESIKASVTIASAPGEGTVVTVVWLG